MGFCQALTKALGSGVSDDDAVDVKLGILEWLCHCGHVDVADGTSANISWVVFPVDVEVIMIVGLGLTVSLLAFSCFGCSVVYCCGSFSEDRD